MTSIRPMASADWLQVDAAFAAGIAGGKAAFETTDTLTVERRSTRNGNENPA